MADNVAITPGSGANIAADEVVDATLGTVKVQLVKVVDGTNDSTTRRVVEASGGGRSVNVRAGTSAVTSVTASATNQTLLSANANRLGATVFNDSSSLLYLKLGATASATSHTIQVPSFGYYELPFSYSGIIDGIWATATGAARVTELT
jgi:hypothetical protein